MRLFGANGYKKTSVSDIAAAAGISKAMVFHYFGTKKTMYVYLMELSGNLVIDAFGKNFDNRLTDFFDRIRLASEIKMSVMKKHPAIFSFLKSMYFETDPEVRSDIRKLLTDSEGFRSNIALSGIDASKFKQGVDPKLVLKMLIWIAEGFTSEVPDAAAFDVDILNAQFEDCMNLLKNNLYKEEYL